MTVDGRNDATAAPGRTGDGPEPFGIVMTTTPEFLPFLAASVASLRTYNKTVPVSVFVGGEMPGLRALAEELTFDVTVVDASHHRTGDPEAEAISSRLVKIQSLVQDRFSTLLYLDCDTLLQDDIGELMDDLGKRLTTDADLFMLLNRPGAPRLWYTRATYFRDAGIDRDSAARLIGEGYGIEFPPALLNDLTCWNSGVIFGSADGMRRLGESWLRLYRHMLRKTDPEVIIPRDQLPMWLALWLAGDSLRVEHLPARWNFMAGNFLNLEPGLAEVDDSRFAGAAVLHLAQNKYDPWALRRVRAALAGVRCAGRLDPKATHSRTGF